MISIPRFLMVALVAATICRLAGAQENVADGRARLLLNSEIGTATSLGFKLPAISVGPSVEIPVKSRFEFQSAVLYSPDRKLITDDGNAISLSGSAIGFATSRLGIIGKVERTSLWTSRFDESAWAPSAGVVIRNDYVGPGRLHVTYVFPTGCVWATSGNPCTIQSKRLQGLEVRQDARLGLHKRWGFDFGVYHFCDQSNQNDPQAGRHCHVGGSAMVTLSFETHLGRPSLLRAEAQDNF
jgi:hypothetical protein